MCLMETALMCNVFNVCMDDLGKMKFYQMVACRCLCAVSYTHLTLPTRR